MNRDQLPLANTIDRKLKILEQTLLGGESYPPAIISVSFHELNLSRARFTAFL